MIIENNPPLNLSFVTRRIRQHWRFLVACSAGGLLLGVITNAFILPPNYTAQGKLLIKGAKQASYIVPLDNDSEIKPLSATGNPVITQIEILNSVLLANRVVEDLRLTVPKKQYTEWAERYSDYFDPQELAEKIKLQTPASTDVVSLKVKTPDPHLSVILINAYITNYQAFLQEINQESLNQRGQYIQHQIVGTEKKLSDVRRQLMEYRLSNQTIDLTGETQAVIQQASDLDSKRIELASEISSRRRMVSALRSQLGMSTSRGIQSVALGMNTNISNLQQKLDEARQEYKTLAVKYTDQNPTMTALQERINEIQQQIGTETRRTVGSSRNIRMISDPVRSNIVDSLVKAESELQGYMGQFQEMSSNLSNIRRQAAAYPEKQRKLAELQDSEKVLSGMVDMLRMKAAEASLRASDELSNVVVIDQAVVPADPDMPTPLVVAFLMMMAGLFGGAAFLTKKAWDDSREGFPKRESAHTVIPGHVTAAYDPAYSNHR